MKTQGARSLDDFCKKFLGPNPSHDDVVPYDLPEIVKHLKETADYDWETFLLRSREPAARIASAGARRPHWLPPPVCGPARPPRARPPRP